MVPIDTKVETAFGVMVPVKGNFPVKLKIPLRQKVRVRDTLELGVKRLRVPLKLSIPIHMQVPIKQSFAVTGEVEVQLKHKLSVPIKQVIRPDMSETIPAVVTLTSKVPAQLKANLDANVTVGSGHPHAAREDPHPGLRAHARAALIATDCAACRFALDLRSAIGLDLCMPKTDKPVNKSDFIRSMPTAHANDVVKAAAKSGIKLSPSFVYAIRAMDKKRKGPAGTPGRKPARKPGQTRPVSGAKPAAISGDHEHTFRTLVLETLGRTRAQEILNELASIGL